MVITMSDYLLEQEISTASCDDITLEQAAAEIEVASSLIDAYLKQVVMLECAYMEKADEDTDEDEDDSDDGEQKPKFFAKIGSAIKKFFVGIFDFLRGLWGRIVNFFKRIKADGMMKRMAKMSEEEKNNFAYSLGVALDNANSPLSLEALVKKEDTMRTNLFEMITELTSRFVDLFDAVNTNLDTWTQLASDASNVSKTISEFKKAYKDTAKGPEYTKLHTISFEEYYKWIENVNAVFEDKRVSEILKVLGNKETVNKFAEALGVNYDAKATGKGKAKRESQKALSADRAKVDQIIKCIRTTGNTVTRESNAAAASIMDIIEAGHKAMNAHNKKMKKTEKQFQKKKAGNTSSVDTTLANADKVFSVVDNGQ